MDIEKPRPALQHPASSEKSTSRVAQVTVALPYSASPLPSASDSSNHKAEKRATKQRTDPWTRTRAVVFKALYITLIASVVYFVFIGRPLWDGAVYTFYRYVFHIATFEFGWLVFVVHSVLMTWPQILFGRFEPPRSSAPATNGEYRAAVQKTALIIPCYKSGDAIEATLKAALKTFPTDNIFVVDNGNFQCATDDTPATARRFGVNYIFVPIGSKIIAEYVACINATAFEYCLFVDDDVELPPSLPLPVERFEKTQSPRIACIGYTIHCRTASGALGTPIQQLQDFEYRASGLMRCWSAKWGSALFPHGAIMLWKRDVLMPLFQRHHGYVVSEDFDWGRCVREAGYRVDFCSSVSVATAPPPYALTNLERYVWPAEEKAGGSVGSYDVEKADGKEETEALPNSKSQSSITSSASSQRGGYGELTVLRQRLLRWNVMQLFFLGDNLKYMLFYWNLGWRTVITKWTLWNTSFPVLQYILGPFFFPLLLWADYATTLTYTAVMMAINLAAAIAINALHLRSRPEGSVRWIYILFLYVPYTLVNMWVGTLGMVYAMIRYYSFFAHSHQSVPSNTRLLSALPSIRIHQSDGSIAPSVVPSVAAAAHKTSSSSSSS